MKFSRLEVKRFWSGEWEVLTETPSEHNETFITDGGICNAPVFHTYTATITGEGDADLAKCLAGFFEVPVAESPKDCVPNPGCSYWHEGSLCTPGLREIGQELG
jgi:hypothetical protein